MVTFALRLVKFVTSLLFKDSSGNKQMTTAIIATKKVVYLILWSCNALLVFHVHHLLI